MHSASGALLIQRKCGKSAAMTDAPKATEQPKSSDARSQTATVRSPPHDRADYRSSHKQIGNAGKPPDERNEDRVQRRYPERLPAKSGAKVKVAGYLKICLPVSADARAGERRKEYVP